MTALGYAWYVAAPATAELMLDNIDVAILTRLNDLAERRGLKPYDFVATVQWNESTQEHALCFEMPASGNALREERFDKMLHDLGIVITDRAELKGSPKTIMDALDHALSITAQPRRRF